MKDIFEWELGFYRVGESFQHWLLVHYISACLCVSESCVYQDSRGLPLTQMLQLVYPKSDMLRFVSTAGTTRWLTNKAITNDLNLVLK